MERTYGVVVAGGGPSGCSAALAAAREGARVLLIERYGFLGGMATAGLVNPFTPYCLWNENGTLNWNTLVNAGLFKELMERLRRLGGLADDNVTFNEELLKLVLDRTCAEFGVQTVLHGMVIGCHVGGGRVRSVEIATKSGVHCVDATGFVDATGDADLAAAAGCRFTVGDGADGRPQPMTLCFRIANVNVERFRADLEPSRFANNMSAGEIDSRYLAAKKLGRIARNPSDSLVILSHMLDSVVHFNSTRVLGKVSVKSNDLSEAEVEGREQAYEIFRFLREEVPGFETSYLLMSGPQIGVRESRRIIGATTVTCEDLMSCRKHEDSIARGTWHIELHNPHGSGTRIQRIPPRDYYTIPFGALYSLEIENLLVTGRAVSATQEAHSAIRAMPICASIGEAAGIAVARLVPHNAIWDIDVAEVQQSLTRHGALF